MDEVTKLTLLTLIVAILALIITIMTIQKGRLRLLFQIVLSLTTCYGLLNLIALFKKEPLHIWALEEYNPDNIRIFYHEMFWKCISLSAGSWLFFYIGLRLLISKMFHKKLKSFFQKQFDSDKLSETFVKSLEMGQNIRKTLHPTKPQEKREYERNKDDELEYSMAVMNSDLALGIHILICICVLNIPYLPIWIGLTFILLFIMIFSRPIVKGFVDKHYPTV